jgi:HEAT repeat protein
MARTEAAEHLAELTRGINPKSVDDKTVADMVSLLDAPDDSVRAWVAAALGHLGRRAKVAVPKLLALLPEADCLQGDLTSAASIRPALSRMGVKPPPFNAQDCK